MIFEVQPSPLPISRLGQRNILIHHEFRRCFGGALLSCASISEPWVVLYIFCRYDQSPVGHPCVHLTQLHPNSTKSTVMIENASGLRMLLDPNLNKFIPDLKYISYHTL